MGGEWGAPVVPPPRKRSQPRRGASGGAGGLPSPWSLSPRAVTVRMATHGASDGLASTEEAASLLCLMIKVHFLPKRRSHTVYDPRIARACGSDAGASPAGAGHSAGLLPVAPRTQPHWGATPLRSDATSLTSAHGDFSLQNLPEPESCQLPAPGPGTPPICPQGPGDPPPSSARSRGAGATDRSVCLAICSAERAAWASAPFLASSFSLSL